MSRYKIVRSSPVGVASAFKAQKKIRFLFWSWWEDLSPWLWSAFDAEQFINEDRNKLKREELFYD